MKVSFHIKNSEHMRVVAELQRALEAATSRAYRRATEIGSPDLHRNYDDILKDEMAGITVVSEGNAAATPTIHEAQVSLSPRLAVIDEFVTPKAKRPRRTKAEMEAARAAEAPVADSKDPAQVELPIAPAPTPVAEPATVTPTGEVIPSLESARDAMIAFAARKGGGASGIAAARELLQQFNVGRIGELKPEQYAAFINAAAK